MSAPTPKRTLSGRLFMAFLGLALSVLFVSVIAMVDTSWRIYEGDAEERLSSQAQATAQQLSVVDEEGACAYLASLSLVDTRATLVAGDGRVVFDSQVDAAEMPNHADRAEVVEARESGRSVVQRRSETTGSDTLYVAVSVPDSEYVVRLAETRASRSSYLSSVAVPVLTLLILASFLALVLARFMAREIAAPLVDVDLDDPLACEAYDELMPLLERVATQRTELTEKNKELSDAVEARREFTGNVSHEMKSPLQVIGGYAELIESGIAGPEDVRRFAGLIHSETQTMRLLIDDVLTLSKLDEMQVDCSSTIDMAAISGSAVARLLPAAEARGITLTLENASSALVRGSSSLAEQMVYNLIDNAIRYGHEGGVVEVVLSIGADAVEVRVSDDGPGVSEEYRERIFERFFRMDASRNRETGGTGLGLAIVKHAALTMGGTVRADESARGGLAVVVTLPLDGEPS